MAQEWNRVEQALLLDLFKYLGPALLAQVLGRGTGDVTRQARAVGLLPATTPRRRPAPALVAAPAPLPPMSLQTAPLSKEDKRLLTQKVKAKQEKKRTDAVEARKPKHIGLADRLRGLPYNHPERTAYRLGGLPGWREYQQTKGATVATVTPNSL